MWRKLVCSIGVVAALLCGTVAHGAYTGTWNEATPAGSALASTIDDYMRELKRDLRERLSDSSALFNTGLVSARLKAKTYTYATLPATCTDGEMSWLSDNIRGVWMCNTNVWHPLINGANVMDFGAVGNGTADDYTAIAAAITAVAARGGGDVILPAGFTYKIGTGLVLTSGIRIRSNGVPAGHPTIGKAVATIQPTSAVPIAIKASNQRGVGVSDLTVDLVNAPTGAEGIKINATWQWDISNVTVKNLPAAITSSVSAASWVGGVATFDTSAAHGLTTGDYVIIVGASPVDYNYRGMVTVTDADTFTLNIPSRTRTVYNATWAADVATITTTKAHLLTTGDTVTISAVSPTGYNVTGTVASTPTTTSFTIAVVGDPGKYSGAGTVTHSPEAYSSGGTVDKHAVGIHVASETGVTGSYFGRMNNVETANYAPNTGQGIGYVLNGVTGLQVTSTNVTNARQLGQLVGWIFDTTGSGIVCIDCGAEDNASHGMYVLNTTTTAAGVLRLIGGEINGNGGWGITGDSTGRVGILSMVVATNTAGNIDTTSLSTATLQIGADFTGANVSTNKTFVGGFQAQTVVATDLIDSTTMFNRLTAGSAITMSSDPQIATGTVGQVLVLIGTSNTNTITIKDGQGARLSADMVLGNSDTLTLVYDNVAADWTEIGRSNN